MADFLSPFKCPVFISITFLLCLWPWHLVKVIYRVGLVVKNLSDVSVALWPKHVETRNKKKVSRRYYQPTRGGVTIVRCPLKVLSDAPGEKRRGCQEKWNTLSTVSSFHFSYLYVYMKEYMCVYIFIHVSLCVGMNGSLLSWGSTSFLNNLIFEVINHRVTVN